MQLGDGTTTDRYVPGADLANLASIVQLSLGYVYSCALRASGGVTCWGHGGNLALGTGGSSNVLTPASTSVLTNVAMIATGSEVTCALMFSSGGIRCWGACCV